MPRTMYRIPDSMKAEIARQYTTRLPDGTWKGSEMIARDLSIAGSSVQNVLHEMGIPIRSAKEAHSHGKRCGPVKYTERLDEPSLCQCGCGEPTYWDRTHNRWARYVRSHRHKDAPYKHEDWLREQYVVLRRTVPDIANECAVNTTTIIGVMKRFGIARRHISEALKGVQAGEHNPAWKGGVTPERQRLYGTDEWKTLVKSIFARDNYTCQRCKKGISGTKKRQGAAHHIKSWADYRDLRFEPSNLVTLCRECHVWVHSLDNKAREFLG